MKNDTRRMEDEARKMECKMEALRRVMEAASDPKSRPDSGQGSRWKAGSASKPITKGYVQNVLDSKSRKAAPPVARQAADATMLQAPSPTAKPAFLEELGPTGGSQGGSTVGTPKAQLGTLLPNSMGPSPVKSGASSNLQAALQKQNGTFGDVEAFLGELKLDRYVGLFMEHGFDDMDTVQEMQENHMRDIGMAPGHIIKLRKRLAELNPQPAPPPAPVAPQGGASPSSTSKRVSFGGTETRNLAREASGSISGGCGTGSLKDGPGFDEKESADSFQEALMAWRTGGSAAGASSTSSAKAGGAAEASQSGPKGSFWSTLGGAEVDLVRASTPLASVPKEMRLAEPGEGIATQAAPSDDKVACYQCYKQFFSQYAVERKGADDVTRRICSEACADAFVTATEAKAEAQRKRREQIEKMQEMTRAMEESAVAQQPDQEAVVVT